MEFKFTNVFKRIVNEVKTGKTTVIAYGGSSSSKTISIMQFLTLKAIKTPNLRITMSSESLPIIRKTMFMDWKEHIIGDMYDDASMNKTEMVYSFPNGSIIQWIPADDAARWHGLRQHYCYFDELYYCPRAVFDQAEIRTSEVLFASFNPVGPFWVQDIFDDKDVYVDHSTYKDNPFITDKIRDSLEKRANVDKNFYDVYVLGQFGKLEGLVFKEGEHWGIWKPSEHGNEPFPTYPYGYKRHRFALDFGYSIDATAGIEVGVLGDDVYLKERIYSTELTNEDIAGLLTSEDIVIADSSEPKSIEELNRHGLDVSPAVKGKDSINAGIQLAKQHFMWVEEGSTNLIKEFRNYGWRTNSDGTVLQKPIDRYNHGLDGIRYTLLDLFGGRNEFVL